MAPLLLFRRRAEGLEQRVHRMDHGNRLGRPLRRDDLLYRARDVPLSPDLRLVHQTGRETREASPGLLDLEPAGAQGMVRQGGHGELRAPGGPAGGPHLRRPVQRPDLDVLDQEGSGRAQQARPRQKRCPRRHEVVPRPWLRQLGGHLGAPHTRL